jgi:putative tricarboxylic transport membrane protein
MHDVWQGVKDVFRHWTVWVRSTIIGYIIGIIPGVGAETATFVAYGQAKQTSKHPERFGSGVVEGVIASESANNAKEAGALLTTLALGVPGSGIMALLLGAIYLVGLVPGPEMITRHLDLSLTLLLVVAVSNIVAVAICLPLAPYLAKMAYIPSRILVPLVLAIALAGVFACRELFNDLIICLIFCALGLVMKRFGYNRPALFLGYVLGRPFEEYFFIALQTEGPLFFLRPISLTLILMIIALFAVRPIKNWFLRRGVNRTS